MESRSRESRGRWAQFAVDIVVGLVGLGLLVLAFEFLWPSSWGVKGRQLLPEGVFILVVVVILFVFDGQEDEE
jgi:hypothetical protein